MRDRDRDMQIIEVLSPDDPSFGTEPTATTDDTALSTPSKRAGRTRHTIIAGLTALLLVAGVVVAIDGEKSAVTATTTTTTTATATATTTKAATATARLEPIVPGDAASSGRFVVDNPELRPYSADVVTPLASDAMFQLWTSGDPSKPWLSVQAVHSVEDTSVFTNSARRVVDGLELVSRLDKPDTTDLVLSDGGWTVTIHSSGIDDGDLTRFANGLAVNGRGTVDANRALEALGLTLVSTRLSAEQLLYNTVTSQMRSLTADGTVITLRVADGWIENLKSTLPYFATGLVENSDERITGTLIDGGDAVVLWGVGDQMLSLSATMTPDRLLGFSYAVRSATDEEWKGILNGLHPDYRIREFERLAGGTAADGSAWLAGLQLAGRDGRTQYLWWWTSPDRPETSMSLAANSDLAIAPHIDTIVVRGATYVFISVPSASTFTTARVVAADGTATDVPLVQPFPNVPVRAGVARIDTPGFVDVAIDGQGVPTT